MNIKKLSPVTEFLRANHAKAKNLKAYYSSEGNLVKTCNFFDSNGNYIGRMTRIAGNISKNPVSAELKSFIEIVDTNKKTMYQQLKENVINFAKVLDKNKKNLRYLPEKMTKIHVLVDEQGQKTTNVFERTINSSFKLLQKSKVNANMHTIQNTYQALEPVKYAEKQLSHIVEQSGKL